MKCDRYQELLMRYFDHDLNHKEQELFHQHSNDCRDCRNLFEDLHRILIPLEATISVEPDPGLEKLVMEQIKILPVTYFKTKVNGETGLAKMIYGWLATTMVLLMLAIHLALWNTNFSEFLLQSRQYFNFLSGIALDSQIIYQVVTGVFGQAILSISREIQNIYLAAILFGIVLTIRFTVVKLANPKLDFQ